MNAPSLSTDESEKPRRKLPALPKVSMRPSPDVMKIVLLWAEGKPFDAWEQMAGYINQLDAIADLNARDLARKSALEWKHQMESRMLTRAWRTMYAMSREVERSATVDTVSS